MDRHLAASSYLSKQMSGRIHDADNLLCRAVLAGIELECQ